MIAENITDRPKKIQQENEKRLRLLSKSESESVKYAVRNWLSTDITFFH